MTFINCSIELFFLSFSKAFLTDPQDEVKIKVIKNPAFFLVFRKNWSGETRTLTTFVKGSYNTFDTGIVSDASLLPGANGKFDLYVPQDFGTFIGYSYVIDWEEYQ